MNAIEIVRSEHRALAAVLTALQAFLAGVDDGTYQLDIDLLKAMIQYITELPDRVHHPKEDGYLFVAVRRRSPETAAVLDVLEEEHRHVHDRWRTLAHALDELERAGRPGLVAFRSAVDDYVDFQWRHMATEEAEVLPRAQELLLPEDWAAIDAAFAANDNPWEGSAGKYRALFTRIVSIAPAPIGVADSGPSATGR